MNRPLTLLLRPLFLCEGGGFDHPRREQREQDLVLADQRDPAAAATRRLVRQLGAGGALLPLVDETESLRPQIERDIAHRTGNDLLERIEAILELRWVSLLVIVSLLAISVLASVVADRREARRAEG